MTKFEQIAINIQTNAYRKDWAIKQFQQTCYLCALRGRHVDCDKCIIASTHQMIVAIIDDKERLKGKTKQKQKGDCHHGTTTTFTRARNSP